MVAVQLWRCVADEHAQPSVFSLSPPFFFSLLYKNAARAICASAPSHSPTWSMSGYAQHPGCESGASQSRYGSVVCKFPYQVPRPLLLSPEVLNQLNGHQSVNMMTALGERMSAKRERSRLPQRLCLPFCKGAEQPNSVHEQILGRKGFPDFSQAFSWARRCIIRSAITPMAIFDRKCFACKNGSASRRD